MKTTNLPKFLSVNPVSACLGGFVTDCRWLSSAFHLFCSTVILLIASASSAVAGVADIVGTWAYSESVQLEFKPDGTILSNSREAGTWSQREKISEYMIVLNDGSRHVASLDKYKRNLTAESRARGVKKYMSRIDNGPTVNSDVPNERDAWGMECSDLDETIRQAQAGTQSARRQAGELWAKHRKARAIGRISSWNIEAERADARARNLERLVTSSHARLAELKSKLAIK